MKILDSQTIKAWDRYTIDHEPISSSSLMERAASVFADWYVNSNPDRTLPVFIFCGNGNNGGDGLVVGRLLMWSMYEVYIYKVPLTERDSPDFTLQWQKTSKAGNIPMKHSFSLHDDLPQKGIVIDAILGTGLTRSVQGEVASLISRLNSSGLPIISIDIPSGMPADGIVEGEAIRASDTLTFQIPKYSFFLSENASFLSRWNIGDIGLHQGFLSQVKTEKIYVTADVVASMYRKRSRFAHKGTHGTVLLLAGSSDMPGACVLAGKAALRSGAGLVKAYLPQSKRHILMAQVPEAIALKRKSLKKVLWHDRKNAVSMGPGLGTCPKSQKWVDFVLSSCQNPMVIDADGLNILSLHKSWLERIPKNSILTPHPGEFARLFGSADNSLARNHLAQEASRQYHTIIILKGAYTHIFCPEGEIYVNSTGNPGMATAGSGDVLTGIVSALLAQQYNPKEAAVLGTYIHGMAGDKALQDQSMESLVASDIIEHLGEAWKEISAGS